MPRRSRSTDNPPFKIAGRRCEIPSAERDRALLTAGDWPGETAEGLENAWKAQDGHLFRRIAVQRDDGRRPRQLWEALVPFPNSPVYGTHRYRPPDPPLEPWPNLHTMRVIGSGTKPEEQIKHVYLLHNGLNETTDLMFHYRLAAWILGSRRDSVCILRPLPGHLTRFPFSGLYAELPLATYLRDPASVFRQFLRYMQETQWLLSILVPRPHYAVAAGTRLLRERIPTGGTSLPGRADNTNLAREITREWQTAFQSTEYAEKKWRFRSTHSKQPVTAPTVAMAVSELRKLLNWSPTVSTVAPKMQRPNGRGPADPEPPCIHVVGYSIGGFMAQAAFFAWPFAIASCTNLFAGGALRDLAPTAFARPEEWQAVLHGLRYELDRAFREGYLSASSERRIAGIAKDDFGYFTRIFYEVYLQYYRGGYASRVSEFSRRLLFVVGGDDPIVRTKNVLDAGPPQGINLLQVANVSHFPGGRPRGAPDGGQVESEQRRYWLPEVGRIIGNFSEQAEGLLHRTLGECWQASEDTSKAARDARSSRAIDIASAAQPTDQDPTMLASMAFASELRELIECSWRPSKRRDKRGWLLVARNELSPVFLGPVAFRFYAQAIHHSEDQIAGYIHILRERADRLEELRDRLSLLIPTECEGRVNEADWQTVFAKSETPSATRIPSPEELHKMWNVFRTEWRAKGAVGVVKPDEYSPDALAPIGVAEADRLELDSLPLTILPDVWIALSGEATEAIRGNEADDRPGNEKAIVKWVTDLTADLARDHTKEKQPELDRLKKWIDDGDVLAITVSGAELNPRYRGHRLLDQIEVCKALIHWSLAFCASDMSDGPWEHIPVSAPTPRAIPVKH